MSGQKVAVVSVVLAAVVLAVAAVVAFTVTTSVHGQATKAPLSADDQQYLAIVNSHPELIGNQETQIRAGRNVCFELRMNGQLSTLRWLTDESGFSGPAALELMHAATTAYCPDQQQP